jgi:hypothetical protein
MYAVEKYYVSSLLSEIPRIRSYSPRSRSTWPASSQENGATPRPNRERTCFFISISPRLAGDLNTSSIISNDTFAVSGTIYVAQRYAKKHALPKTPKVSLCKTLLIRDRRYKFPARAHAGEFSISGGVMRPTMTEQFVMYKLANAGGERGEGIQLFNQFDAVDTAAPFPLMDNGNTSFGRTQPIGPKLRPYAAVKRYTQLDNLVIAIADKRSTGRHTQQQSRQRSSDYPIHSRIQRPITH